MLFAHFQKSKTPTTLNGVWLYDAFVDTTDYDACLDATEIITLLLLLKG